MNKILFWGDTPTVSTGFGNVSRLLLSGLHDKGHKITVLGINERGGHKSHDKYPYAIYPAIYNDYSDWMGYRRFVNILAGIDPEIKNDFDTLIVNFDVFHFTESKVNNVPLIMILSQLGKNLKKIIYAPIDNSFIPLSWKNTFDTFDNIAVPSHFGKSILEKMDIHYRNKTTYIPYPVDTELFTSFDDLKKNELKKHIGAGGKFVIGCVARNSWRKDLYRIMRIFKQFNEQYSDTFLYIHTNPQEPDGYAFNLYQLAENLGLREGVHYVTPKSLNFLYGIERQEMINIYNVMDVNLSATMGEGLGLPFIEAMSCGILNIAPNNSTIPEIMNFDKTHFEFEKQAKAGRGLVYKTLDDICIGNGAINRWYPIGDVDMACKALEWAKNNKKDCLPIIERAKKYVKEFNPSIAINRFDELIK